MSAARNITKNCSGDGARRFVSRDLEFSRTEAIEYSGYSGDKIVTIDAGIDARFRKLTMTPAEERAFRGRPATGPPLHIPRRSSIGERKRRWPDRGFRRCCTNLRGDLAGDRLRRAPRGVAEIRAPGARTRPRAEDVVLTGFVPDDDLVGLYNLCHLFVFPWFHEGLGHAVGRGDHMRARRWVKYHSVPEIVGRPGSTVRSDTPDAIADAIRGY